MGLRRRVTNAVDRAFKKVDDLLEEATLSFKNDATFDFSSQELSASETSKSIRLLIEHKATRAGEETVTKTLAHFKKKDSSDRFNNYTHLKCNGIEYKVLSCNDNGYSVTMELSDV